MKAKPKKQTVMLRFPIDGNVHDQMWGIYMRRARGLKFENVLQEIMTEGARVINERETQHS